MREGEESTDGQVGTHATLISEAKVKSSFAAEKNEELKYSCM